MVLNVVSLLLWLAPGQAAAIQSPPVELLTVAERSEYRATSTHAQVMDFCRELAKRYPAAVRLAEIGKTSQGRPIPILILSRPAIADAKAAIASGKPVFFALGNIHAGEVCGKEALCILARELARGMQSLLDEAIVVVAPVFNGDGNDRIAKTNRPHQAGPEGGVGIRPNAGGLDLNRDFVKLESPEVRALVRAVNQWHPLVFVDTHATNGTRHRYAITYDGPRHPATDAALADYARKVMLPEIGAALEKTTGYAAYFYGNFRQQNTIWESYPAEPRYGVPYFGLRHCLSLLSEAYAYAPYQDRVLATQAFTRLALEHTVKHRDKIKALVSNAEQATIAAGNAPRPEDRIPLRFSDAPIAEPVTIRGFGAGDAAAKQLPKDYPVQAMLGSRIELGVARPYAYLIPPELKPVVENLQRHSVQVDELREDIELDVEAYRIDAIKRANQEFQKHRQVTLEAVSRPETRRVEAGTLVVRAGQPLGTLAVLLLEPQSADGLATWNLLDPWLAVSQDYPILRLPKPTPLLVTTAKPLPEDQLKDQPFTFDVVYSGKQRLDLSGDPAIVDWLPDGEHYLQRKGETLSKVVAATGRATPFYDEAAVTRAIGKLPTIGESEAAGLLKLGEFTPDMNAMVLDHGEDLYYVDLRGPNAFRLTVAPGPEELKTSSPNGKLVAFVRDQNLFVVDTANKTERALTTDGGGVIWNGKADWVYFEEIYDRQWKAFWWRPDSQKLAFLRFDDSRLKKFPVANFMTTHPNVQSTPYPKSGDPNPQVRLGIVAAAGGPVQWIDLDTDPDHSLLTTRVGWRPNGEAFFMKQDRAQTWLDLYFVGSDNKPRRILRDTTKAWVGDPGDPTFLKDGSFLFVSERTGWKHLYHYDAGGKLIRPVTSGEWEMRRLQRVDETEGWVYFRGTKDNPTAASVYRVKLDGSKYERVSQGRGDRTTVEFSPNGRYYVDTWSDQETPPRVHLFFADGRLARRIDTNPVRAIAQFKFAKRESFQIPTTDGFMLDAAITKPTDFDPKKKYPVWITTYGGPHSPTISDAFARGRTGEQALAAMGMIVFGVDPRSASGKGAVSAWSAYRKLGVQECKDLEEAVTWLLEKHPYADGKRVGIEGHSYGGYLTSYCLTHSKMFAAGIAGAPVTDWRLYDTIYTERYMNTPAENPDGYEVSSVVKAAKNLSGKLLLIHGAMDDNVHLQNTLQLARELQRAAKPFEMMIYPTSRHGVGGRHYNQLRFDFIRRSMGLAEPKK